MRPELGFGQDSTIWLNTSLLGSCTPGAFRKSRDRLPQPQPFLQTPFPAMLRACDRAVLGVANKQ